MMSYNYDIKMILAPLITAISLQNYAMAQDTIHKDKNLYFNFCSNEEYSPINNTTVENSISLSKDLLYKIEIENIINKLKENGFEILSYWIPDKDLNERTTIFFECKIPDEIIDNYEKLEEFEYSLYRAVKPMLKQSKFFKMVALL